MKAIPVFPSGRALPALAGLLLCLVGPLAQAQVYRIVGPDGKVTFSDRPPSAGSTSGQEAAPGAGSQDGGGQLPYGLKQVAQQYPVTFYSGKGCTACDSARSLLVNRGIPFAEKTINTNADIDALKRITGDNALPAVSIGRQQLRGFSESDWNSYLDAAGYPAGSQLPPGYRRAAPSPLVAGGDSPAAKPKAPPEGGTSAGAKPDSPSTVTPNRVTNSNPAGIQF
ncbi:MAG: glutaredoxin family protein [Curvibacter sp.]|nr:glutaredoxin family protein [Curvibacter sp.]